MEHIGILISYGSLKVAVFKKNDARENESAFFTSLLIAKLNQLGCLLQVMEHTTQTALRNT